MRIFILVGLFALLGCADIQAEQSVAPSLLRGSAALDYAAAPQQVARYGSISLEVPEGTLDGRYSSLREELADEGALLSDITYGEYGERRQYSFTVRVAPTSFDRVMERLKQSGEVRDISVRLEDLTEQYVELDIRISNREAELQRLQELYNRSESVGEILEVEKELTRVETELESLKRQKQGIVSRVERSTITITIYEDKPAVARLALSLGDLWAAFFGALAAAITLIVVAAGFLLPICILLSLAYLAYGALSKRKTKERMPPPK